MKPKTLILEGLQGVYPAKHTYENGETCYEIMGRYEGYENAHDARPLEGMGSDDQATAERRCDAIIALLETL